MQTLFDPLKERMELDDAVTGYRHTLKPSLQEVIELQGVAHWARASLSGAVAALLAGYDTVAARLLERAHEWLRYSVENNEITHDHQPHGSEAQRHLNLALSNWLLFNEHDSRNFGLFVEHEELFMQTPRVAKNKIEVSLVLPHYVDAGACRQAIARYQAAGLIPPQQLDGIRTEGQMSYVLSEQSLGEVYTAAEADAALGRFLRRSVNGWLINGHYLDAAEWMKIAHWNGKAGVTARDAVMKLYDYLPGVSPPADRR